MDCGVRTRTNISDSAFQLVSGSRFQFSPLFFFYSPLLLTNQLILNRSIFRSLSRHHTKLTSALCLCKMPEDTSIMLGSTRSSHVVTLPPEIVGRILRLGTKDIMYMPRRWPLLKLTSLVCQSWRIESQRVLWEELFLRQQSLVDRILSSPALGRYATKSLTFVGGEIPAVVVEEVMAKMVGVQHFELRGFNDKDSQVSQPVNCQALVSPNFSGK